MNPIVMYGKISFVDAKYYNLYITLYMSKINRKIIIKKIMLIIRSYIHFTFEHQPLSIKIKSKLNVEPKYETNIFLLKVLYKYTNIIGTPHELVYLSAFVV